MAVNEVGAITGNDGLGTYNPYTSANDTSWNPYNPPVAGQRVPGSQMSTGTYTPAYGDGTNGITNSQPKQVPTGGGTVNPPPTPVPIGSTRGSLATPGINPTRSTDQDYLAAYNAQVGKNPGQPPMQHGPENPWIGPHGPSPTPPPVPIGIGGNGYGDGGGGLSGYLPGSIQQAPRYGDSGGGIQNHPGIARPMSTMAAPMANSTGTITGLPTTTVPVVPAQAQAPPPQAAPQVPSNIAGSAIQSLAQLLSQTQQPQNQQQPTAAPMAARTNPSKVPPTKGIGKGGRNGRTGDNIVPKSPRGIPKGGKGGRTPAPKLSSTQKYLNSSADYQNTLRDLNRSLADFQAQQSTQKSRAGQDYGLAQKQMGDQRTQDLSDLENDFAARGILHSGVYGSRLGTYNTQYDTKQSDVTRAYSRQMQDFNTAYNNFVRQQSYQKEAAREAAIRRRAATLGKIQ